MINGHIQFKSMNIMIPLFKSLVRPILEYGNAVWNTCLVKHTDSIENVQRRFTRKIIGLADMDYDKRLETLKLPSLEYRRLRGDLIEIYKMTHGFYDSKTINSLFTFNSNSVTRGHPYKLSKISYRTAKFGHFFTNRLINVWNNLSLEVVSAGTVNLFKNRIDLYFQKKKYTTHLNIV